MIVDLLKRRRAFGAERQADRPRGGWRVTHWRGRGEEFWLGQQVRVSGAPSIRGQVVFLQLADGPDGLKLSRVGVWLPDSRKALLVPAFILTSALPKRLVARHLRVVSSDGERSCVR